MSRKINKLYKNLLRLDEKINLKTKHVIKNYLFI